MRELVWTGFVSLDGVVDSPGGGPGEDHRSAGWVFRDIAFLPEAVALKGAGGHDGADVRPPQLSGVRADLAGVRRPRRLPGAAVSRVEVISHYRTVLARFGRAVDFDIAARDRPGVAVTSCWPAEGVVSAAGPAWHSYDVADRIVGPLYREPLRRSTAAGSRRAQR